MSTNGPGGVGDPMRGRHRGMSPSGNDPTPGPPGRPFISPPQAPVVFDRRDAPATYQTPIRPSDPWADGRQSTPRQQTDVSLILAALVMMALAVGVIVGVAML